MEGMRNAPEVISNLILTAPAYKVRFNHPDLRDRAVLQFSGTPPIQEGMMWHPDDDSFELICGTEEHPGLLAGTRLILRRHG